MNDKEKYLEFARFCKVLSDNISELYNLDKVKYKEGSNGLWTCLDRIYIKKLGASNKYEIHYYSDNSPYLVINRNFWENRAISIRKRKSKRSDPEVFCEIMLSCGYYDDEELKDNDKDYKHYHEIGGKYHINEIHAFSGKESYDLIIKMHEFIQNSINKYYETRTSN